MGGSKHIFETCWRSRRFLQRRAKVGSWLAEVLKRLVQGFWGKNEHWVLREGQVQTSVGHVCFCCSFLWWHCDLCEESNPVVYWGVRIHAAVPSSLLAASQKFRTCWGSGAQWHQVSENMLHSVLPVFSLQTDKCWWGMAVMPRNVLRTEEKSQIVLWECPGCWQRVIWACDRDTVSKGFVNSKALVLW